jgi:hypothetical protein
VRSLFITPQLFALREVSKTPRPAPCSEQDQFWRHSLGRPGFVPNRHTVLPALLHLLGCLGAVGGCVCAHVEQETACPQTLSQRQVGLAEK